MSSMFRKNIETDFEYFVKNIVKLEPAEFCGLARILSVPMVRQEKLSDLSAEDIEKMKAEIEIKKAYLEELYSVGNKINI